MLQQTLLINLLPIKKKPEHFNWHYIPMNPIIRESYIILFIATIIPNWLNWLYRPQENMLPLHLLQHMPCICPRIFLQGWDFGMNAFNQILFRFFCKMLCRNAGIKGHWDEELHGLDYLVYAYLQKGENDLAKEQLIILKRLMKFIRSTLKLLMPLLLFLHVIYWKIKCGKKQQILKIISETFHGKNFHGKKRISFCQIVGICSYRQSERLPKANSTTWK